MISKRDEVENGWQPQDKERSCAPVAVAEKYNAGIDRRQENYTNTKN